MLQSLFQTRPAAAAVGTITPSALQQRLDAGEPVHVVDVRSAAEFAHDGRVAQARLLPLPVLAERLAELPRDVDIVVVCRSGQRSGLAAELLARRGFDRALNLVGGMQGWARAGLPLVRG